ncbi:MAG: NAD(P)H-hydrate epimerase, partial [Anaerolineae bacterium]|nr:NAD(P)H-hydrate epimerase [Anaerolineae bacterium]
MAKLMTIEQIRNIEARADAEGVSYAQMMDNAGYAIMMYARYMLKGILDKPRIVILVGAGNNGGDGLVAGKYLAENGDFDVRFYLLKRLNETYAPYQSVLGHGLFMAYAEDDADGRVLRHMVASADLVIDALLGIGGRANLVGDLARIIRLTRQAIRERKLELNNPPLFDPTNPTTPFLSPQHHPRVLAVDCPSGINCDTGEADDNLL